MTIEIIVKDEVLDFETSKMCLSFESAAEELGKMERNYARRIAMELDKGDVMAEAQKEEQF